MDKIKIHAPATVANLSCGFDILGLCLNEPYDEIEIHKTAEKNVSNAFKNLRKRETHIEITDLNRISNGGVVFITGKILAGTAINLRRSRFNVPVTSNDKAYSFDENGIKFNSCKELLKNYQQYFFKMPA